MKKEKDIIKKKIQWPSRSLENREKKTVEVRRNIEEISQKAEQKRQKRWYQRIKNKTGESI